MSRINRFLKIASISLLLVHITGYAQEFKIRSQNFLHLGWGTSTVKTNKCTALNDMMNDVDIIVVQELMQSTDPCPTQTSSNNFTFIVDPTALGNSSYKEYYGFYVRNGANKKLTTLAYTGELRYATGSFERPPRAIALKVTKGSTNKYVWIGDIHSIFGKKVQQRYDEAGRVRGFYQDLQKVKIGGQDPAPGRWPVIIAGDWNIPVTRSNGTTLTPGFSWLPVNMAVGYPAIFKTTLSAKAKRSSAYDHFIYDDQLLSLTPPTIETTASFVTDAAWRKSVSDHLGIVSEVSFK
jgi:hypothetical protein